MSVWCVRSVQNAHRFKAWIQDVAHFPQPSVRGPKLFNVWIQVWSAWIEGMLSGGKSPSIYLWLWSSRKQGLYYILSLGFNIQVRDPVAREPVPSIFHPPGSIGPLPCSYHPETVYSNISYRGLYSVPSRKLRRTGFPVRSAVLKPQVAASSCVGPSSDHHHDWASLPTISTNASADRDEHEPTGYSQKPYEDLT